MMTTAQPGKLYRATQTSRTAYRLDPMGPDTAAEWFERIRAMVEACDRADTDHKFDAMRTIEESIQGVQVRFGWHKPCAVSPGDMRGRHLAEQPAEYRIILSPHVRIVGELDEHGQPVTARLEFRDDGEWTVSIVQFAELTGREATAILLRFATHFYFGGWW